MTRRSEFDPPPDAPLTTKEGWTRWVGRDRTAPELREDCRELAPPERADYDDSRLDYHSDLIVVNTPTIQDITKTVRRLLILNRRQISARRGLIVTGGAGTGKTTALTQLGLAHQLHTRLRNPVRGKRIPVVYITLPPAATARMVAVEFARFLGLPVTGRSNLTDITNSVCAVLCDVGCDLVLVDEIHNISLTTRAGAEVSDQLKYFSERIPATFVYAGIDVEHAGLFSGIRGRQIASRFATISTHPFAYGSSGQREHWRALVVTLEQALRLHQHKSGTLARQGQYLYQRTHGMLGSLSHLIRGAAIDAILDGSEKITKAHLDAQRLDRAANIQPESAPKKRSPKRRGSVA
ncbi:TniB family NTP-binding protein [Rhodococcus sp. NPDC019616]|uniref:TniB family NTP-binding protein n=1 Tax=Rhodococcus sp. NPDC019616 TaxID=3154691 RepID=UPI002952EE6D|nr:MULTISPECIES: TniB family NTP-binding protein [Rhodococcus]MDV7246273.1 TniB family NTP-binding protein [Rhodococcus oxybenzonivorans]MDV7337255.1 TniB family NTP-binding protein [Rhodococcus oxybenzonivorans]MDV8030805.1 TniB family NTP-binding protein [Rhodococcus sp. IEGM 27]